MAGSHHQLNGHGIGWTPGVGDGQGGLVCCVSWGRKERDTTEQLNWTEVYTQVALNAFTLSFNHCHHPSPECFHHSKLKQYPLNSNSPFLPPLSPWQLPFYFLFLWIWLFSVCLSVLTRYYHFLAIQHNALTSLDVQIIFPRLYFQFFWICICN